jgi:hypothetical protein
MSELLQKEDMQHESLEEEERRLGPDRWPVPDWLNVKKQVRSLSIRNFLFWHPDGATRKSSVDHKMMGMQIMWIAMLIGWEW